MLALGTYGVAVTQGADGCLVAWRGAGGSAALPALAVDVVDTTGCGDGFTAGMPGFCRCDLNVAGSAGC